MSEDELGFAETVCGVELDKVCPYCDCTDEREEGRLDET